MNGLLEILIDLPWVASALLKGTVLLAAAWVAHFALSRRNARWRVLLWRGVIVGLVALPVVECALPVLEIGVSSEDALVEPRGMSTMEWPDLLKSRADTPPVTGTPAVAPEVNLGTDSFWKWVVHNMKGIVAGLWAGVSVLLLVRSARGVVRMRGVLANSMSAPDIVVECARDVAQGLGVQHRVDIRVIRDLGSPFLAGVGRPVIVLPERVVEEGDTLRLRVVLAHELVHVKHGDIVWMAVERIVSVLLWFHPLQWRVRDVHGAACEEVCDAVAAEYVGGAERCAQTLANEALALLGGAAVPGGLPMLGGAEIMHRLRRLQQGIGAKALAPRWVLAALTVGVLLCATLGSLRLVQAAPEAVGRRTGEDRAIAALATVEAGQKPEPTIDESVAVEAPGTTRTLRLRVVDEEGEPLPGVFFSLRSEDSQETLERGNTGEDGRYVWEGAPAKVLRALFAYPEGDRREETLSVQEEEIVIAFDSSRIVNLRGSVVDAETGADVAEYEVWIGTNDEGTPMAGPFSGLHWDIATGAVREGNAFTFKRAKRHSAATLMRLAIVSDGYFVQQSEDFPQGEAPESFAFRLEKGAPIKGRVVDGEGDPVPRVKVHLTSPDFVVSTHGLGNAISRYDNGAPEQRMDSRLSWMGHNLIDLNSRDDGQFELPALRPPYRLVAVGTHGFAAKDVTAPEPDYELRLDPYATLTIDNTYGAKVGYFGISPAPEAPAWFYVLPTSIPDMQSPTIILEGLPPGRYLIHPSYHAPGNADPPRYGNGLQRYVTLAPGENRRLTTLENGPEVVGRLTLPEGMKATVELRDGASTLSTSDVEQDVFRFYVVPPGHYELVAKRYAADTPKGVPRDYTDYVYSEAVVVEDGDRARMDLGHFQISDDLSLVRVGE